MIGRKVKIVDGIPVDDEDEDPEKRHPWQVGLMLALDENPMTAFYCGGSLIADDWVITAGHCVLRDRDPSGNFSVVSRDDINVFSGESNPVLP